jgi:hypothetical protein
MNKECPNCYSNLTEINYLLLKNGKRTKLYPKEDHEVKGFHEYRFYCDNCYTEWLYLTRPDFRVMEEIFNPAFEYDPNKKVLIER